MTPWRNSIWFGSNQLELRSMALIFLGQPVPVGNSTRKTTQTGGRQLALATACSANLHIPLVLTLCFVRVCESYRSPKQPQKKTWVPPSCLTYPLTLTVNHWGHMSDVWLVEIRLNLQLVNDSVIKTTANEYQPQKGSPMRPHVWMASTIFFFSCVTDRISWLSSFPWMLQIVWHVFKMKVVAQPLATTFSAKVFRGFLWTAPIFLFDP